MVAPTNSRVRDHVRAAARRVPAARWAFAQRYLLAYLRERLWPRGGGYAQFGEDQMVAGILGTVSSFVDVGAHDGITGSNTFRFALRGASGLCVEPVRDNYWRLRSLYAVAPRVRCIHAAVSDYNGFAEILSDRGLSRFPETADVLHLEALGQVAPHYGELERVRVVTFTELMKMADLSRDVDLLSIDVEGHEVPVLRSIPFSDYTFRLIIVETHFGIEPTRRWLHPDHAQINGLLSAAGYRKVGQTAANSLYAPSG